MDDPSQHLLHALIRSRQDFTPLLLPTPLARTKLSNGDLRPDQPLRSIWTYLRHDQSVWLPAYQGVLGSRSTGDRKVYRQIWVLLGSFGRQRCYGPGHSTAPSTNRYPAADSSTTEDVAAISLHHWWLVSNQPAIGI